MTNRDLTEEIAETVRNLREHLSAWKSLATQDRPDREIARLDRLVEDEVALARSDDNYREHAGEFLKALDRASDDSLLIQRLHEEILRSSTV
jgi:hypothetical protein